jgi:hypothetical protein
MPMGENQMQIGGCLNEFFFPFIYEKTNTFLTNNMCGVNVGWECAVVLRLRERGFAFRWGVIFQSSSTWFFFNS